MLDYHTHTSFSDDCKCSIEEMVDEAIRKGLTEYAITDHHDPDYPIDHLNYTFELDIYNYHKAVDEIKDRYKDKIRIKKGIELGLQLGSAIEKCNNCNNDSYDFIIGSFHLIDYKELSVPFVDGKTPEEANIEYYSYIYKTIKELKAFDILGHINAIDRYTEYIPDFNVNEEIISEILKVLVENGKGLELNTSSFRYKMDGMTMPSDRILRMYKDIGGEIITFGSDAHAPQYIAHNYNWATDYLKSFGFERLTIFDKRNPDFIKI